MEQNLLQKEWFPLKTREMQEFPYNLRESSIYEEMNGLPFWLYSDTKQGPGAETQQYEIRQIFSVWSWGNWEMGLEKDTQWLKG